MKQPIPGDFRIRRVTARSLAEDLKADRLQLHPDLLDGLADQIAKGILTFFIAESPAKGRLGQAAVRKVPREELSEQMRQGLEQKFKVGPFAGNIAFMDVEVPYRRRGIGRRLLEATHDEIRRYGRPAVAYLGVDPKNTGANRFYKQQGFQGLGFSREVMTHNRRSDGTYGPPVRAKAVFLGKSLSS